MSVWHGASVDGTVERAVARAVEQFACEMQLEHICVICNQSYVPWKEMGKRSCSMHPMMYHNPGTISASKFIAAEGTSRANERHFACCGSYFVEPHQRDLTHEFIDRYRGCTSCDHISNRAWTTLLASFEHEFYVAFNNLRTDPFSHASRHWLVVLPLTLVQFIATLRWPERQDHETSMREIVTQLMGKNTIIVDRPVDVLGPDRAKRIKTLKVGTRVVTFDAREAYIYMMKRFAIPTNILTNEMAATAAPTAFSQAASAATSSAPPDAALHRVLSMLGLSKVANTPVAVPTSNPTPTLAIQSRGRGGGGGVRGGRGGSPSHHHSTEGGSSDTLLNIPFVTVDGKSIGAGGDNVESRMNRKDLYAIDADELLKVTSDHSHNLNAMRKLIAQCVTPADAGRTYAQYLTQLVGSTATFTNDVFFKFAVGSWIDTTNITPAARKIINTPCTFSHDLITFPHTH